MQCFMCLKVKMARVVLLVLLCLHFAHGVYIQGHHPRRRHHTLGLKEHVYELHGLKVGDVFDESLAQHPVRHARHRRRKYREDTREPDDSENAIRHVGPLENTDNTHNSHGSENMADVIPPHYEISDGIRIKAFDAPDDKDGIVPERLELGTGGEIYLEKIDSDSDEHASELSDREVENVKPSGTYTNGKDDSDTEFKETKNSASEKPSAEHNGIESKDELNEIESETTNTGVLIDEGGLSAEAPKAIKAVYNGDVEQDLIITIDDDDEDDLNVASGSGDHEDYIIETTTEEKDNKSSDEDYWFIEDNATDNEMTKDLHSALPKVCESRNEYSWGRWSPWLQLGEQDFRFRRCHSNEDYMTTMTACEGESYEVRQCMFTDERLCRQGNNTVTEEFRKDCKGVDLDDVIIEDVLDHPETDHDNCKFELYDITYKMMIGNPLTATELLSANPNIWCTEDDIFVPFYTPKLRCRQLFQAFCNRGNKCAYDEKKVGVMNKNGLKKMCWKKHMLDGLFPEGILQSENQQVICQRFDKRSKMGEVFGGNKVHYTTLYDTGRRIPVLSAVRTSTKGDDKWPAVPYMIEQGLMPDSPSIVSWMFKDKKRGMTPFKNDPSQELCELGRYQALPTDIEHTRFVPIPLIPPSLIGDEIDVRVSTFSMINVIPLEPSLAALWKKAMNHASDYLKSVCISDLPSPEVYILSGTSVDNDHAQTIGNDVTVPDMIWMSACCLGKKDNSNNVTISFAIYAYNQFDAMPELATVSYLQELLSVEFSTSSNLVNQNIVLYPGRNNECSLTTETAVFNL